MKTPERKILKTKVINMCAAAPGTKAVFASIENNDIELRTYPVVLWANENYEIGTETLNTVSARIFYSDSSCSNPDLIAVDDVLDETFLGYEFPNEEKVYWRSKARTVLGLPY